MSPTRISFNTGPEAVEYAAELYHAQIKDLREAYEAVVRGEQQAADPQSYYPSISIRIDQLPVLEDRTQSYGFCASRGIYEQTITRPDILGDYYAGQLDRLIVNHGIQVDVMLSKVRIPLPFALNETYEGEQSLDDEDVDKIHRMFFQPSKRDYISEPDFSGPLPVYPLFWDNAPLIDESLQSLIHYTGTDPQYFQDYILFTNYQDYVDEFIKHAKSEIKRGRETDIVALVEPGHKVTLNRELGGVEEFESSIRGNKLRRDPQMPAYHMVRLDGSGTTMVNIGVGPSNANTMTEKLKVLRPQAWMMVGHCAGLSFTQKIGDYVLPNGFIPEEGIVQKEMAGVDVPELAEMHRATTDAIRSVLGVERQDYKESVRTGIITTVADRTWENPKMNQEWESLKRKLAKNRSIAVDMETATIAYNGFKYHVPYGALLCVSDKPLHGQPKMPGAANKFYRSRVQQQFLIAMAAIENVRAMGESGHSRKMRSDFEYVPVR